MGVSESNQNKASSGLQALAMVAGYFLRPVDAEQLGRSLGHTEPAIAPGHVVLAAQHLGLKAKVASLSWRDLERQRFPLIAELGSGQYVVLTRMDGDDNLFFVDPADGQLRQTDAERFTKAWTGRTIFIRPRLTWRDESGRFGLRWFIPVLGKYRRPLIETLIAAFIVQVFGLAMPLFVQLLIDKVLTYHAISTLQILAVGMLGVIGFELAFNVLKNLLVTHTSNRIDVTLGSRLFAHLLRIPLRYFETRTVGSTVARVRELEVIRQFLTGPSLLLVIDSLFVFVFIIVLLVYSWQLTLVTLAVVPVFALLLFVVLPLLQRKMNIRFDRGAENQAFLVESVTGIQTVKALAIEARIYERWERTLSRYVMSSYEADRLSGVAGALGQAIQKVGTLAILWVGVYLALDGQLTVGQLIAFQMISGQVTGPILRLVQFWQHFQQIGVAVDRIGDLMNAPAEPVVQVGKSKPPPIKGRVTVEDLHFRYSADMTEAIRGVSFEAAPGSFVGVVGASGSGKSTLIKLLQRLYDPTSGTILVDGIDLRQVDPSWFRHQVGFVLQESYLFAGTIRENIAIQFPEAPLDRVEQAAQLAGAHDFIMAMPEGYDSEIVERGESLSGGQRQRVAIARALLADPRILIFDEATSSLDPESERIIQTNLAEIRKGRTVFMAAHRLATIREADLILVMDEGRLVEHGTHDELIALNGRYARMVHG